MKRIKISEGEISVDTSTAPSSPGHVGITVTNKAIPDDCQTLSLTPEQATAIMRMLQDLAQLQAIGE
jgi:hypothetical protein